MTTFLTVLLILAVFLIQCMAGGTRLAFSLPVYGLLGIAAVVAVFRRPLRESRPSLSCLVVSAIFFTYILIRAARSPVEYLWWNDFYMVLGCLLVYLLTTLYITRTRERLWVVWGLLGIAVLEVFIGLRQFSAGDNWLPFGFQRADVGRRASGMLISPIHLAGYLEAVAPFALAFAFWATGKMWKRILAGYVAILCYVGVAITGSRGGYLSVLFSLVVFWVISLYARRVTRPALFRRTAILSILVIVGGTILAGALMSQSDLLRKRLSMIPQQLEKNGLDIRIYNWQATLDQYRVSPIFGTGAGTHLYYGRYFRRPPLQSDPMHAHGDYLELLAEYGIVGAIGMAAFLLVHLTRGFRNLRGVLSKELANLSEWTAARHDGLALYIGALTAISALLAHSVVDFNLHIPGHALMFAFIFGLIASPVYGSTGEQPSRTALVFRWALPALGIFVMVSGLPKFPGEYMAEKARGAFRRYDFEESIRLGREGLHYTEKNPELFFFLGAAHRGAGITADDPETRVAHFVAAVEAYERGLSIFPQDEHMLIRYAQTLTDLGEFERAEQIYRAALVIDKNLAKIHAYYARHLAIVGRDAEAEERLGRARELAHGENVNAVVRGTSLDPRVQEQP